ncbi:MAG: translation initiation factor IF-2 [Desulfarculaceae bacterium]|nr:translation initiation factor IF-2 [Desulfarculaceae bacterium]
MAKVRVYELARELNMTNKALLGKLDELDIKVKSHMSSLDDPTVGRIKQKLFGREEKVDDVKVQASVIRRRKAKKPETPADEPDRETETDSVQEKKEEEQTVPPAAEEKEAEKAEDHPPDSEEEAETAEAVPPPEPEESPEPGEAEKAHEPSETEKAEEPSPAQADSKDQEEAPAAPGTEPDESEAKQQADEKDSPEPAADKTADKAEPEKPAAEDAEKAAGKKKKKKKSEPAKIIKLGDAAAAGKETAKPAEPGSGKVEAKTSEKAEKADEKSQKTASRPQPPEVPAEEKAKGRKKDHRSKKEAEGGQEVSGKKRKKKKKKSVVEGNDLYSDKFNRKKSKKGEAKPKKGSLQKTQITTPKAIKRRVKIDETIELSDLAKRMGIKANEMISKLMGMGVMATVNQTIDFDTASLVAGEFGYEVEKASFEEDILLEKHQNEEEDKGEMIHRAPVVTIMGHVDHGKTSLLDVIRKSKITTGEAGGITQHIGAYKVETNSGEITFLDTPGHAAFTSMRSRGAQITDIVVLVVAADDGVMPQTIEAINHSKQAGVPVVVAVNKMDKPGADPSRITRELAEHDLLAEAWGGDVIFVEVSAKAETGINDLLEMILLQSEVLELKANPDKSAFGYVVESRLDTGRGPVATILVQEGTLREGDSIVCGLHSGKIRAMINDLGERAESAGPSTPVEIIGLNGVPDAGDEVVTVASDKDAKQISEHRMQKQRAKELAKQSRASLEKLFQNMGTEDVREMRLIVKADVQGSIEALNDSLRDLAKEEVDIKIIHSAPGAVNESDISLAVVSDAIIIGFNVRPTPHIRKTAKEEGVDMRFYDIIYDVINDIKAVMEGLMPSTFEENIIGRAEVRNTFVVPGVGTIAGSYILAGRVQRGKKIRLLRDGVVKCDSELSSLKRYKDDVKEVVQGYECGIGIQKFNDIKLNDIIECYEVIEKRPGQE